MATDPITHQPICCFDKCISSRTTDISGAMPNHAKKHRKKAIHDMWNARICGVANVSRDMRVALWLTSMANVRVSQRGLARIVRHGPKNCFHAAVLRKRRAMCRLRGNFFGIPKSRLSDPHSLLISTAESASNAAQSLGSFGVHSLRESEGEKLHKRCRDRYLLDNGE